MGGRKESSRPGFHIESGHLRKADCWLSDQERGRQKTWLGNEPGVDFKNIGYYTLVSILVAFTIFGLIYMIRTNCKIRERCCKCCVDLEKEDKNLDYGIGAYYYDDGERRQDVMEVTF